MCISADSLYDQEAWGSSIMPALGHTATKKSLPCEHARIQTMCFNRLSVTQGPKQETSPVDACEHAAAAKIFDFVLPD
jgi:hypothetical protein